MSYFFSSASVVLCLLGLGCCSSPSTLKPGEVEGVASIDIVNLVQALLKRGDFKTVSPRSTVEPCVDRNLKQHTQKSIRSFKNHMCTWMIVCPVTWFNFTSHLSQTFIFGGICDALYDFELYFKQKHKGRHSLVDLTMETKAQFYLIIIFTKVCRSIQRLKQLRKHVYHLLSSVSFMITSFFFCVHRCV